MDSTNPDLSAFAARGGKLIISEHMADYAQSPYAGIDYYRAVVIPHGPTGGRRVHAALRDTRAQTTWAWARRPAWTAHRPDRLGGEGQDPGELVQVKQQPEPPFAVMMSRPMCRYPAYPRYRGGGDPLVATSFECASPSR